MEHTPQLPAGFTVDTTVASTYAMYAKSGMGGGNAGTKKNELPERCFSSAPQKASLTMGWMRLGPMPPSMNMNENNFKQPESATSKMGFVSLDEPGGKEWLNGGVLSWRKLTWTSGETSDDKFHCPGKQVTAYTASWVYYKPGNKGAQYTVSLQSYLGSKNEAKAVMQEAIAEIMQNGN